jgi:hypothetical protein
MMKNADEGSSFFIKIDTILEGLRGDVSIAPGDIGHQFFQMDCFRSWWRFFDVDCIRKSSGVLWS